jgi:hypothetical protein
MFHFIFKFKLSFFINNIRNLSQFYISLEQNNIKLLFDKCSFSSSRKRTQKAKVLMIFSISKYFYEQFCHNIF